MSKVSWKYILRDFNEQFSKVNLARQVLWDLFNNKQGNGSEITFVAGATKISLNYCVVDFVDIRSTCDIKWFLSNF